MTGLHLEQHSAHRFDFEQCLGHPASAEGSRAFREGCGTRTDTREFNSGAKCRILVDIPGARSYLSLGSRISQAGDAAGPS